VVAKGGIFDMHKSVILFLLFLLLPCPGLAQHDSSIIFSPNLIYGFPGTHGKMLDRKYYIVSYRTDAKVPEWTSYRLVKGDLDGPAKRTDDFRPDPDLASGERSELKDYVKSGFARGHSAPAEDFDRNLNAMSSTFLLSNMSPQHTSINSGKWSQLEANVRDVARELDTCWIYTGTIFKQSAAKHKTLGTIRSGNQRKIGKSGVWVPTHFYKIILAHDKDRSILMWAFLMEHRNVKLPGKVVDYAVSVDSVQKLTGLDFFKDLPDETEHKLESQINHAWPLK
jgi:endonuclease G